MSRSNSKRSAASQAAVDESVAGTSLASPLELPAADREAYWNGLFEDPEKLRAATASMEFFQFVRALPRAFWEKRILAYLYRTQPKVKNQAGDKAYIERIASPFDEERIKENHGGGSYLCYLNLDGDTSLKQISFSIDGPPKLISGQVLVDGNGNPITIPPTAAEQSKSDVAQAIAATSEAQRVGMELIGKATENAMDLQHKVMEKAAGVGGNNTESKLLDLLITRAFPAQTADPMTAALTMMKSLDEMIARRMPKEPAEPDQKQNSGTVLEQLELVSELTGGQSLPDLMKAAAGMKKADDSITGILAAAGAKLIENLPTILQHVSAMQERNFQRQIQIAQIRAGQQPPPAALPPGTPPPSVPAGTSNAGFTVAPPPVHVMASPPPAVVPPAATQVLPLQDQPTGPDVSIPLMVKFLREKFEAGYTGHAVAQALDVLFPDLLGTITPTVLDEHELTKFLAAMPELAPCLVSEEWPQFRTEFVEFVRDEYAEDMASDDHKPAPVMSAATA